MYKSIFKYAMLMAVAWTLIIFGLCCMPGQYIPTTSWLELLSFDKFVHAFIFCVMAFLWFIVLVKLNRVSTLSISFVLLTCIVYGGMLEIMQATLFTNRSADWFDFIANSVGVFVSLWLFYRKKDFLLKNHS